MRKTLIIGLVALLAVLGLVALAGCSSTTTGAETTTSVTGGETTTTSSGGPVAITPISPPCKVKIAYDDAPGTAAIILADKMGYFKEVGIEPEYVKFASGAVMYNSLAAGQVDIGRGVVTASLFNGAATGVPVWLVADSGTNVPGKGSYFTMVIRPDMADKIKDFPDLKGKNIAIVSVGSINEYFMLKALEKGGLTKDDVKTTIIAEFPDLNTALGNKAVDAAVQIEPLITSGEKDGILKYWKDAETYAPDEQVAALLYSDKFAKQNPECAKAFMVAYLKGARVYNDAIVQGTENQDEVIKILTENTFVTDPEMWKTMRPTGLSPDGTILTESVMGQQDYFKSIGEVKETVTQDKVIDESFIKNAQQILGSYTPPAQ